MPRRGVRASLSTPRHGIIIIGRLSPRVRRDSTRARCRKKLIYKKREPALPTTGPPKGQRNLARSAGAAGFPLSFPSEGFRPQKSTVRRRRASHVGIVFARKENRAGTRVGFLLVGNVVSAIYPLADTHT